MWAKLIILCLVIHLTAFPFIEIMYHSLGNSQPVIEDQDNEAMFHSIIGQNSDALPQTNLVSIKSPN